MTRRLLFSALLLPAVAGAQVRPPVRPATKPAPKPAPTAPTVAPSTVPQLAPAPKARVTGSVLDSATLKPLVNASVQFVLSTDPSKLRSATTDSLGQYVIDSLSLGTWIVGVLHEQYERLGVEGRLVQFIVEQGGDVRLDLGPPGVDGIIGLRCGAQATAASGSANVGTGDGAFIGLIRQANGQPLSGPARLRVQYIESTIQDGKLVRRFPARFVDAAPNGAFAACGIPVGVNITTRAFAGSDSSGTVELTVPRTGLLVRDILIAQPKRIAEAAKSATDRPRTLIRGDARVRGVVRDTAGKPVNNARIVLSGDDSQSATSSGGVFNLGNLPPGTWMMEARAVGYQPQRFVVDLRDSLEALAEVNLTVLTPTVDTVKVQADKWSRQMEGFENRRKVGMGGYFLDEKKIVDRNAMRMADLLRGTPGVSIQPGGTASGRDQVRLRSVQGTGQCFPNVFLNGVYTAVDNGIIDDLIRPEEVRAIEVYPGTATLPIEFQRPNGCGSIAIWTGPRGVTNKK